VGTEGCYIEAGFLPRRGCTTQPGVSTRSKPREPAQPLSALKRRKIGCPQNFKKDVTDIRFSAHIDELTSFLSRREIRRNGPRPMASLQGAPLEGWMVPRLKPGLSRIAPSGHRTVHSNFVNCSRGLSEDSIMANHHCSDS
jgi:hypothetical protein